jgi:hypothetical protein
MPRTRPSSTKISLASAWRSERPGCGLEHGPHRLAIAQLVGLARVERTRRPLGLVEPAELDAGAIDDLGHLAAERVDLPDQVALGDPADGRVARHVGDGLEVAGQDQRARAQAGGGERRLAAGVPAPMTATSYGSG